MLNGDQAGAIAPVVWNALGYQFEAASMVGALGACLIVRVWVCLSDAPKGLRARALNVSITLVALLFTAGWVLLQRPSPFYALLSGSGFGALGSGIILISLNWVRRLEPMSKSGAVPDHAARRRARSRLARSQPPSTEKGVASDGKP